MKSHLIHYLTSACIAAAALIQTAFAAEAPAAKGELNTQGQPTIGNPKAPVQVVAFLEPKCPDSKNYHLTVFPKLKDDYISTNKVRYTVIPVSFLTDSMPAAIALLCVYNQNTQYPDRDLFFKYLTYLYQNQPKERTNWATLENLQKFAEATSPAIQLDRLKSCIERENYRVQIEKNTAYGTQIMGGRISTPTLFVDGVKFDSSDEDISYDHLRATIDQALQKKGIHRQ